MEEQKSRSDSIGFVGRGGLWVVFQTALFATVVIGPPLWPPVLPWVGESHRAVGWVLLSIGIVELAGGFIFLGSSLTPLPYPKDNSQFRKDGLFRLVRHPIYGGLILIITGYCLTLSSMTELAMAAFALLFFDRKAHREERWLRDRFPGYFEYSRRTKKFIPWLY